MRRGRLLQNTPPGCICRVAGCRASRLLLSFFIAKRKEQSLSALRAAPSGQLRSETPLRRQKCSLRIRSFAPCGERPGRRPGPAALWKGRPQTLDPTGACTGRKVVPGVLDRDYFGQKKNTRWLGGCSLCIQKSRLSRQRSACGPDGTCGGPRYSCEGDPWQPPGRSS